MYTCFNQSSKSTPKEHFGYPKKLTLLLKNKMQHAPDIKIKTFAKE